MHKHLFMRDKLNIEMLVLTKQNDTVTNVVPMHKLVFMQSLMFCFSEIGKHVNDCFTRGNLLEMFCKLKHWCTTKNVLKGILITARSLV